LRALDESLRAEALSDGRSIDSILDAMARSETRYQTYYARLLGLAPPEDGHAQEVSGYEGFAGKRRRTIDLLGKVGEDWPQALLDRVKQQVADDREHATRIAERRRELVQDS
jgi:hypothetical protein